MRQNRWLSKLLKKVGMPDMNFKTPSKTLWPTHNWRRAEIRKGRFFEIFHPNFSKVLFPQPVRPDPKSPE
jgi:hypothetical protein